MEMIGLWLRDCSDDVDEMGTFADDNDILWRCSSVDRGSVCDSEMTSSAAKC